MKNRFLCFFAASLICFTCFFIQNDLKAQSSSESEKKEKDYAEMGMNLIQKESLGFLKIELTDKEVIKKIGKPKKKSNAEYMAADGLLHQSWFYSSKGIELDMVGQNKNQLISAITINKPCTYATKRGIKIGSKKEEVLSAYKEEIGPDGINGDSIVAGSVYGGIFFSLKDGKVISIFMGAAAE